MNGNHNCAECERLLAEYSHAVNEFAWVDARSNVALLSDAIGTEIEALESKRSRVAALRHLRRQEFAGSLPE